MNEDIDQNESYLNEVLINCEKIFNTNINNKRVSNNFINNTNNKRLKTIENEKQLIKIEDNSEENNILNKKKYLSEYLTEKQVLDDSNDKELTEISDNNDIDSDYDVNEDKRHRYSTRSGFKKSLYERRLTQEEISDLIRCGDNVQEIDSHNNMITAIKTSDSRHTIGYRCNWSECEYINSRKIYVSRHIRSKHKNEWQISRDKYSSQRLYLKNVKVKGLIKKRFKCDWIGCHYETNVRHNLTEHCLRHKNIKNFKCDYEDCVMAFVTFRALEAHRLRIHSDKRPFDCVWPGCEAKFKTKADLTYHHNNMHIHKRLLASDKRIQELTRDELLEHLRIGDIIEERNPDNDLLIGLRKREISTGMIGCLIGYRCNWPECHYIANSREKYRVPQHIVSKHTKERPYICDECGKRFATNRYLESHKKLTHSANRAFKCHFNGCPFVTKHRFNLTKHFQRHENSVDFEPIVSKHNVRYIKTSDEPINDNMGKKFKCDWNECQYETNNRHNLTEHCLRHQKIKNFKCDNDGCDKAFVTFRALETHKARVHTNERPFACVWPECGARFKIKTDLNSHRNNVHFGDKMLNIGHNSIVHKKGLTKKIQELTKEELSERLIIGDIVEEIVPENKLLIGLRKKDLNTGRIGTLIGYRCNWFGCHYIANSREKYRVPQHIASKHTKERPFTCDECSKRFCSLRYLKAHKSTSHTARTVYKCDWSECRFECTQKSNLNQHYMRHQNIRRFGCDFENCDKKFVAFQELERHKDRVHFNLRRFMCVWPGCESRFNTDKELKCHENRHKSNRTFKCDFKDCGVVVKTTDGLRRHKELHKPVRRHVCHWPQCDQSFVRLEQFRIHIAKHSGELPFKCESDGCFKSFRTNKALTDHMSESH